jgi:transcriptional regulator with XRE-family HTH domain
MFSPGRLKEARAAMREHGRSVSQERFAELIGVSRRSPQRWEGGKVAPHMRQLSRISTVTGKPVEFFFEQRSPVASPDKSTADDDLEDRLSMTLDGFLRLRVRELVREETRHAVPV